MKARLKEALGTVIWYAMLAWLFIYWLVVHSWRERDEE